MRGWILWGLYEESIIASIKPSMALDSTNARRGLIYCYFLRDRINLFMG